MDPRPAFRKLRNGLRTENRARVPGGTSARVSVKGQAVIALVCFGAASAGAEAPQSFRTDILPILTKAGCNAGACHGAATGQGGFKLSLLGYDPEEDYDRITREFGGRRISTARA